MENVQLPRFNTRWRDPKCEDVDNHHLQDTAWQRETNYCNPPWLALPALCAKLRQSGAAATVIAPYWPHKPWFQDLHSLAIETIHYPPRETYSSPGGTAHARGSDDHDGASWLFDCHAGLASHPHGRTRTHTTDGQLKPHRATHYGSSPACTLSVYSLHIATARCSRPVDGYHDYPTSHIAGHRQNRYHRAPPVEQLPGPDNVLKLR
jgi:hypothetical protein